MNKNILVIDDEKSIRDAFVLALEETDYQVTACTDGPAALAALAAGPFDLIYLDLKMPGMNGVEVLRRIRQHDRQVPVYIVTAFYGDFADELAQLDTYEADFDVLIKPIGKDDIIQVTHAILDGPRVLE